MDNAKISPDEPVSDIMDRWPQTMQVFVKYHTSCIGCSMSMFDTVRDIALNYDLSLETLLGELEQSIEVPNGKPGTGPA